MSNKPKAAQAWLMYGGFRLRGLSSIAMTLWKAPTLADNENAFYVIRADDYDALRETMWNRILRDYESGMSMGQALDRGFGSIGIHRPAKQPKR